MELNKHFDLKGKHALLSPSNSAWLRYDSEKLEQYINSTMAKELGTRYHEYAATAIELGLKQPRSKKTLNMYINDAIGYHMTPEQPLYYSPNCFGTADSISFRHDMLRVHDLKTGRIPAKMDQLLVYTALFCLEYKFKPSDIEMECRIYQFDEIQVYEPTTDDILPIMDKIITFDSIINDMKYREA